MVVAMILNVAFKTCTHARTNYSVTILYNYISSVERREDRKFDVGAASYIHVSYTFSSSQGGWPAMVKFMHEHMYSHMD